MSESITQSLYDKYIAQFAVLAKIRHIELDLSKLTASEAALYMACLVLSKKQKTFTNKEVERQLIKYTTASFGNGGLSLTHHDITHCGLEYPKVKFVRKVDRGVYEMLEQPFVNDAIHGGVFMTIARGERIKVGYVSYSRYRWDFSTALLYLKSKLRVK